MILRLTLGGLLALSTALPMLAAPTFNRIASFAVADNAAGDKSAETSAEIIAASEDGMVLVYTDSPAGLIGLIDIAEPTAPKGAPQALA